jgi:hypothetical protein
MRATLLFPASCVLLLSSAPAFAEPGYPAESGSAFRIGIGPMMSLGPTPGVNLGMLTSFSWYAKKFFSLSAEMRMTGSVAQADPHPALSVDGYFIGGALIPCGHAGFFFLCGVMHVGSMGITSQFLDRSPIPMTAFVVAAGARPGIELTFNDRFAVRWFVEGTGVLTPHATFLLNKKEIWRSSSIGVSVGLSFAVSL